VEPNGQAHPYHHQPDEQGVAVADLGLGDVFPRPFESEPASFAHLLTRALPNVVTGWSGGQPLPESLHDQVVDGTTVLAMMFDGGVVMAGDRRATAGNLISRNDMRKVFPADHYSAIAIAGAAGPAMELARIFSTEMEHYEKVEGEPLSLEGKSNKLAGMVRANFPLALQGMIVVPLFAGVDPRSGDPGIFEYDPIGGRYAARRHAASGSGSIVATQALRHGFHPGMSESDAVRLGVQALYDAADQDSATGGPDLVRQILPLVAVVDTDGYRELEPDDVLGHVEAVMQLRRERE
jgi:proteasome beta subunit